MIMTATLTQPTVPTHSPAGVAYASLTASGTLATLGGSQIFVAQLQPVPELPRA